MNFVAERDSTGIHPAHPRRPGGGGVSSFGKKGATSSGLIQKEYLIHTSILPQFEPFNTGPRINPGWMVHNSNFSSSEKQLSDYIQHRADKEGVRALYYASYVLAMALIQLLECGFALSCF